MAAMLVFPLLLIIFSTLITIGIATFIGNPPIFVIFYLAAAIASWQGGLRTGLVFWGGAGLAITYFFVNPSYGFSFRNPAQIVRYILMLTALAGIALLTGWLRDTQANLRLEKIKLRQSQQALEQLNQSLEVEVGHQTRTLTEQDQRYHSLVENIPGAVFQDVFQAQHWKVAYFNEFAIQICGYPATDFINDQMRSWLSIVHPEDRPWFESRINQSLAQQGTYSIEYRIIHADGGVRWVLEKGTTLFTETGQPEAINGVIFDISDRVQLETERQVAELALDKKRRLMEQVAETTSAILYIYDLVEQRNIYVNRQIAVVLGYSPAQIQAMGSDLFGNLVHPDDLPRLLERVEQCAVAKDEDVLEVEYRMQHANGEWCWLQSRDKVLNRNDEGFPKQIVGTAVDITDRKQLEFSLQASVQEKTILLQEVNHRVKNNLQVIVSLLKIQSETLAIPEASFALNQARDRVMAMSLVYQGLYESSQFSNIDLGNYLRSLILNLFNAFGIVDQGIKFQIHISTPSVISLDKAISCGLIVNELITNALKHGFNYGDRAGTLWVDLVQTPSNQVMLTITNDGNPLPPNFDLRHAETMGLQLVQILADQLAGKLEVETGDLTRFRLSFPIPA